MGKRKEIKWRRTGRRTLEGRQNGMEFRIYEDVYRAQETEKRFTVSEYDTKNMGRSISTAGHMDFTIEDAKEFCQRIAAGEIDPVALQDKFNEEDDAKERAAIRTATEAAKKFRTTLDKFGLKYSDLLELEALRANL
ncbi:MAG: hypothetical protein ACI4PV_02280, partial [Butyricicoccus sp.]